MFSKGFQKSFYITRENNFLSVKLKMSAAEMKKSLAYQFRRKRENEIREKIDLKKESEDAVKCHENKNENKKEGTDEKKEYEDILSDPVTYELQVNKSRIKCSKRVIASSHLLLDMIDLTDPTDYSPILIPSFITKQIILDLVEMVEKGDMECAHLGTYFKLWSVFNKKSFSSCFTFVPA